MALAQYSPKRTRPAERDPLYAYVIQAIRGPSSFENPRLFSDKRFSSVARSVIRSIHGIPSLFNNVELNRIEIYLGRASDGNGIHLYTEFRSAQRRYGHDFGVPVARVPSNKIEIFEACKISLLKFLDEHNRLCVAGVANKRDAKIGRPPSSENSIIYFTFKVLPSGRDNIRPTREELDAAARVMRMRNDSKGGPSVNQIVEGIEALRTRSEKEDLCWNEDSIEHFRDEDLILQNRLKRRDSRK